MAAFVVRQSKWYLETWKAHLWEGWALLVCSWSIAWGTVTVESTNTVMGRCAWAGSHVVFTPIHVRPSPSFFPREGQGWYAAEWDTRPLQVSTRHSCCKLTERILCLLRMKHGILAHHTKAVSQGSLRWAKPEYPGLLMLHLRDSVRMWGVSSSFCFTAGVIWVC